MHTKKRANTIIDTAMETLGIDRNMKTDPEIIRKILEEFKLDDFHTTSLVMGPLFKSIVTKPQKIGPMFDIVTNGLVEKHPSIIEWIEVALKNDWLEPSPHILYSVHVGYILELLTAAMANSHAFFVEVQDHYREKERERGVNPIHTMSTFLHALGVTHHLFGTVKALSVDPTMIYMRIQRGLSGMQICEYEAKGLFKNKKINYLEYKLLSPLHKYGPHRINELIRINIYEAGIFEYQKKFKANTLCAHELAESIKNNAMHSSFKKRQVTPQNPSYVFYKSILEKNNLFPVFEFSQSWTSLYSTWNLAFMLGCLDDLDILFPKLLIPSLIDSKSDNFIGLRVISLWLSLNHIFFRKYDKKCVKGPKNKIEMAKAWGEINKKYALMLARSETCGDSKILKKNYRRFFSHPLYNFFKLVKSF